MNGTLETLQDGPSNVLLLAPSTGGSDAEACLDLLTPGQPEDLDVLWVSYTRSADDCLQEWIGHTGVQPTNAGVISVGDKLRSAAAHPVSDGGAAATPLVESVSDPGDLTGLGITINRYLKQWSDDPHRVLCCFHSLTALLQYTDLQTAYKFLHVLTGRLYAADATTHFHADPAAHDEQTIATLTSLFDAVVEIDDGETIVRSR